MADNISSGVPGWRKRMLLSTMISDNGFYVDTDHEEYGVCKSLCESREETNEFFPAAKVLGRRLVNTYLASPTLVALAPFLVGFTCGWIACKIMKRSSLSQQRYFSLESITRKIREGKNRMKNLHLNLKNSFQQYFTTFFEYPFFLYTFVLRFFTSIIQFGSNEIMVMQTTKTEEEARADVARKELRSKSETIRESKVDLSKLPRHIAIIMDGNRRYGRANYGSVSRGHWDGSKKLVEFAKWCLAEKIPILTAYAFSTENWSREPTEITSLMNIISVYCEELRKEALDRGIRIKVLSTEYEKIPNEIKMKIKRMVDETSCGKNLLINICLSYGGRSEIFNACKSIASEVKYGKLQLDDIQENEINKRLLTGCNPDPDIVIRTGGELRMSNFCLWQIAYSEMFFLDIQWPEMTKQHLLNIMHDYASKRTRRYGK